MFSQQYLLFSGNFSFSHFTSTVSRSHHPQFQTIVVVSPGSLANMLNCYLSYQSRPHLQDNGSAQLGTRSRPDRCPSQEKQPQAAMESTLNRRPPCSQRSEDCSEEFGLSCFSWRFLFFPPLCLRFLNSPTLQGSLALSWKQ